MASVDFAGGDVGAGSVLRSWKASHNTNAKATAAAMGMTIFFLFGMSGPRGRAGAGGHRVKAARWSQYEAGGFGLAGDALSTTKV